MHGKSELLGRCAYLSRVSLLSLLLILLLAVSWTLCFRFPHDCSSLVAMPLVYVTQIPRNPLVLPFRALPGDSSLSEPHFKEVTPAQTSAQISGAFGEVIYVCGYVVLAYVFLVLRHSSVSAQKVRVVVILLLPHGCFQNQAFWGRSTGMGLKKARLCMLPCQCPGFPTSFQECSIVCPWLALLSSSPSHHGSHDWNHALPEACSLAGLLQL